MNYKKADSFKKKQLTKDMKDTSHWMIRKYRYQ